jgi:hypothetical protein
LLRPSIAAALDRLFGRGSYQMIPEGDRQRRYGFALHAKNADLNQLLEAAQEAVS